MDIQICMAIVGVITIVMCVLYAHIDNKIPIMRLCGIAAIVVSILGIIYPSWWLLATMCYAMFYLFARATDIDQRMWCNHEVEHQRNFNTMREILAWSVVISEITISIMAIILAPLYMGLLFVAPLVFAISLIWIASSK